MSDRTAVWITGTVISASGYPRKNAEVRGVLFAANNKIGAASSVTDYSGQYFLTIEDGSNVFYTHYTEALVGDPTATMKETIEAADGTLSVSESCTSRLTTDTRTVDRNGTFDGRLVWNGSGFSSHIYYSC